MTTYTFNPPVRSTDPPVLPTTQGSARRLFARFAGTPVGVTVIKTGGVWREALSPSTDELAAAQVYYLGGHVYTVNQAESDALAAAGYAANIEPYPYSYGTGTYGSGPYGGR